MHKEEARRVVGSQFRVPQRAVKLAEEGERWFIEEQRRESGVVVK